MSTQPITDGTILWEPGEDVVNQANITSDETNLNTLPELSVSTTIANIVGVELSPSQSKQGSTGETVIYQHTITNTGNRRDTFNFNAISSQGWNITLPTPITLASNEHTTVQIEVRIPTTAPIGTIDTTTFTATSASAESVYASVEDQTNVNQIGITNIYLPIIVR